MKWWKLLSVFLWFQLISSEFEPCLTERKIVCSCSQSFATILCMRSHLNFFPEFDGKIARNVEKIHLEFNNISQWPEKSYWEDFPLLTLVVLEFNPLCQKSDDTPQRITFVMKTCSTVTAQIITTPKTQPVTEPSEKWKKAFLGVIFIVCGIGIIYIIVWWRKKRERQSYTRISQSPIYNNTTEQMELENL